MDAITLRRVLSKLLRNSGVTFLGVFPADHLPCTSLVAARAPCCYIANSDPCTELGSHWLAFFHPSPILLDFFDSYGKTPAYYNLSIPNNMAVKHNPHQLQTDNSLFCGQWCILFLYRRTHGSSFANLLRRFRSLTPTKGDALAHTFYSQLMYHLNQH